MKSDTFFLLYQVIDLYRKVKLALCACDSPQKSPQEQHSALL